MSSLAFRRANWASELLSFSRAYSGASRSHIYRNNARQNLQYRTFVNSSTPRQNGTTASKPSPPAPSPSKIPSATTSASSTSPSAPTKPTPPPIQDISKTGLDDAPASDLDASALSPHEGPGYVDWTRSYHGLSAQPFSAEAAAVLLQPLDPEDVEIKPDGIIYLPEIKYRRILNRAFGPGGWGLVPRSESIVTAKAVTREYALVAHGRYVFSPFLFSRVGEFLLTTCPL